MPNPLALVWDLIARDNASPAFARVGAVADETGKKVSAFSATLGLVGLVGVASAVKASVDFQSAMLLIHTQARASTAEVKRMSGALLSLAPSVATGPDQLAVSLYHVESVGLRGAAALNVVKIAAEGARLGNADLEATTNALTAALASGIPGVQNASQAMGELNAIVGAGDMKMQDLNDALSTGLLVTVKQYGVSLPEVGAALADFGDNNIRGAEAATKLRMAIQAFSAPMKAGKAALEGIGLSMTTLRNDMETGGLNKALTDLETHLRNAGDTGAKAGGILTEIFGKKAGSGVLTLVGTYARFEQKLKDVKNGAESFSSDWNAWLQSNQGQIDTLKTHVQTFEVEFGSKLLPLLNDAVGFLNRNSTAVLVFLGGLLALRTAIAAVTFAQAAWAAVTAVVSAGISGLETVYIAAMLAMDTAMGPVGIALGVVAAGVAIVTKGFGLFGHSAHAQVQPVQQLTEAITQDGLAYGKLTDAQVANMLESKGLLEAGQKLGLNMRDLTLAAEGNAPAQSRVNAVLQTQALLAAGAYVGHKNLTAAQYAQIAAAGKLTSGLGLENAQLAASKAQADRVAAAQGNLSKSVDGTTTSVGNLAAYAKKHGMITLGAYNYVPAQVALAIKAVQSLNGMTATAYLNLTTQLANGAPMHTGFLASGHSTGTDYFSGGRTWINEGGPEQIDLPKGSKITAAQRVKAPGAFDSAQIVTELQAIKAQLALAPQLTGAAVGEATLGGYVAAGQAQASAMQRATRKGL